MSETASGGRGIAHLGLPQHPAHGGLYRNVKLHVTDPLHILLPLYSFLETAGPYAYATDITAARAQINAYGTALGAYKLDTGIFPTTEQGLAALRTKPENVNNWQGPYLQKEIEPDPWGHVYVYKYPGEHGDDPDLISYGADGQPGGDGNNADIVSWTSK